MTLWHIIMLWLLFNVAFALALTPRNQGPPMTKPKPGPLTPADSWWPWWRS